MQIAVSNIGCMLSNGHLYVKVVIDMNCHCSEWKLVVGMKYIDFGSCHIVAFNKCRVHPIK